MTVLINPGSSIGPVSRDGSWTNTYGQALTEARRWLQQMRDEGVGTDVTLVDYGDNPDEGRWRFGFQHRITGVEVTLETHGIAPMDAYERERIFPPRVYWNGSSSSNPALEDFAAPGFVQTFRSASSTGQ